MWASTSPPPPAALLFVLGLLLGAAFGRWFSARKQVAQAVAAVRAELTAHADARNVVVIGASHDADTGTLVYDDLRSEHDYILVDPRDDAYYLPNVDDDDDHRGSRPYVLPGRSGGDDVRRNSAVGALGAGRRGVGDLGPYRKDHLEVKR